MGGSDSLRICYRTVESKGVGEVRAALAVIGGLTAPAGAFKGLFIVLGKILLLGALEDSKAALPPLLSSYSGVVRRAWLLFSASWELQVLVSR